MKFQIYPAIGKREIERKKKKRRKTTVAENTRLLFTRLPRHSLPANTYTHTFFRMEKVKENDERKKFNNIQSVCSIVLEWMVTTMVTKGSPIVSTCSSHSLSLLFFEINFTSFFFENRIEWDISLKANRRTTHKPHTEKEQKRDRHIRRQKST